MLLSGLAAARDYEHIFVAPHLDDVALSCGGLVAQQAALGQRSLVVTVCAGSPDPAQPLTPFVQYLHKAWQLGDDPMALRRAEDVCALSHLGADGMHLQELDAVYRNPSYSTHAGIFGKLNEHDPLIGVTAAALRVLRTQNSTATIYLPLAAGNHVDHQAVWRARGAVAGTSFAFYEDFPYAAQPNTVAARLAEIDEQLVAAVVVIDDVLPRKIAAIAEYHSQQTELFPSISMEAAVTSYAAAVGDHGQLGERLWLPHR